MIAETPYILMVNPGFPATSIRDFVAAAKAQPGRINVGSSGNGGGLHFTLELFKLKAGLDLNHIPYKGGGPAVADTMAGQIQATFIGMGGSLQYVQSGRLRPLAVTSGQRSAALPAIPTMTELGYDVLVSNWYGVVAPAGTPAAIVQQLNTEIGQALRQTDTRERILGTGLEPVARTPAEFQNWIGAEVKRWADGAGRENTD
jgi:tripartite-type tricarboxylate transporter receptor subunit TctC